MSISSTPHTIGPFLARTRIAYFSMEIAIRPDVPTYSGGLGVLAGDTARSCADLELPVVFVTLISRKGYLRQEITAAGRQVEHADVWDPKRYATPMRVKVAVPIAGRDVWFQPWLDVISSPLGHRVPVLMLDTDLPENAEPDRRLTDHLYGGDHEYRLRQEMVLGIGGLRTLQALGFTISRYHLNEGHAALLALDLLRRYPRPADMVAEGDLGFNVGSVRESCIFTTHTPVEAGHDRFAYDLVERLMPDYFPIDQLKRLAGAEDMNMTRLALNLSGYVNGVAVKHAEVTGKMFPGYRVRAITNGVHLPTWTHPSFARLFNRHVPSWGVEPEILSHVDEIADAEIWDAHADAKREFVSIIEEQGGIRLDPEIPIIGFARRITAYKRPALLFSDISRLCAIHAKTPFQIVVAGKAHPHDEPGKQLLETIHQALDQLNAANIRAVLLPNYNMALAKYLISGVDVWLNTPTPPMEASGTSGMKAAVNGVLNLSVLDGWWLEACVEGATGWAIGHNGGTGAAEATAADLYDKLEKVVLPLYYQDRTRWIWMMKEAISKIAPYFNSQRMMRRYAAEAYVV